MVENAINQNNLVLKITQKNSIIKSDRQNQIDEKLVNSQNLVKLYKFYYVFSIHFYFQH
jgi:hypothetical protein